MHGIHTALVTPFTSGGGVSASDGHLDLDALTGLIRRQLAAGVHGLVPCGTTGETPTLTHQEWREVASVAVREAAGRVPVTVGIGANCTRIAVENARSAREVGVDAGLLVFPWYNKPNPEGHRAHLRAVLDVGLPVVLYHVPGRTAQRLSAEFLAEIAEWDGVVAVKEATGDLRFGADVITSCDTPVLSGDDFTFLPLLAVGASGCISVASNVAPERTVALYEHFIAGRVTEARAEMQALHAVVTYLFSDTNPIPCKTLLAAMGLCEHHTRLPLVGRSPDARANELLRGLES